MRSKNEKKKNNSISRKLSQSKKILLTAASLFLLTLIAIGGTSVFSTFLAGSITGKVFLDYNGSGTYENSGTQLESLVGGVTVTAYDGAGNAQGTTTTSATADGLGNNFTLTATGTGPYRLEFTNVPAHLRPGVFGTGAGTSVQFIPDGNSSNINFALTDPGKFNNETNPDTATTIFLNGQYNAAGINGSTSIMRTPYNATGHDFTGTTPTAGFEGVEVAEVQETGAIYGMAWQSTRNRIYAGAYHKRYSGFGANGPDAIYVFDRQGNAIGTIDLDTVLGTTNSAGADAHDFTATGGIVYDIGTGNASYDGVGKRSIGDIDISADQKTLFVVNLFDRRIYALNIATGVPASTTLIKSWAAPDATGASRHRPFALAWSEGQLWVGSVDENGTNAYVHSMTPNLSSPTGSETFNLETTVPLGFVRQSYQGTAANNAARISTWRAWSNNPTTLTYMNNGSGEIAYPQPILSDIEFDETGSMILGFRDRFGDQTGAARRFRPADTGNTWGVAAGDILRVCNNSGTFVVEGSAGCTTSGGLTNSGPGGATSPEHYNWDLFQDGTANWNTSLNAGGAFHWETTQGGLTQVAGRPAILTTAMDPNNDYSGGYLRLTNSDGRREGITTDGATTQATVLANGGYTLYESGNFAGTPPTVTNYFGKANGLGDIEALTNPPPIEIGNRVWRDTNNNGRQDPGEPVLANVLVGLYNSSGVLISTVETNAAGQYLFSSSTTATDVNADGDAVPEYDYGLAILPETSYTVAIQNANFNAGNVLNGFTRTVSNSSPAGSTTDNNAITDIRDSDGIILPTAVGTGGNAAAIGVSFTTGTVGSNNHGFDFGFTLPVSIGSTVFNDVNNNGIFDAGETGIGGVLVELLFDSNNDGVIDGAELTTPIASISTTSSGTIGNYFFNGLTPGNYQVRIPTPPATATLSSTPTTTTDNQVDNDDNGTQTGGAGGSTISPLINLTPGAEPLNAVETGQGGTLDDASGDSSGDMTIDFGFLAPAALGNRLWIDTNRNGIQDASETAGVDGVTVTLYNSGGTAIATTVTAGGGLYSFTGLAPGTYSVGFARPFGYGFSPQDVAGSTEANDSDVNILTGRTANVTLAAGQTNNDLDAGVFLSVSVGNRVWLDGNNNGLYDGGETFFSGTTVNLYLDANDDGTPDGAAIRTTTTDTNGLYLFDGLAPNNYIVGVVTPTNFVRSSVNGGDPDNNIDNDNNGVLVSGNETRSNPVTLALGTEPTGETPNDTTTTADNSGNLTVDFGFTRAYSIGNRVWFDTNNNGQINAGEVGINGVSVSIFASGNLTTALQTMNTDTNGYYRFDNLTAGSYVVRINPSNFTSGGVLAGYQNTTGNTAANVDSTATLAGEDGINPAGAANTVLTNGILSNVKTIAANSTAEPTGETDVQASGQGTADNQANMTIDFGFYRLSLSGTVWSDTGAGANNNNGQLDAGEAPISGVAVLLYDSAGVEIPVGVDGILGTADDGLGGMPTNSSGNYNFQGLPPGDYRVGVNTSRTGTPSTPNSPNPNNDVDNDNNGLINASFPQRVVSGLVTLAPGSEPTVTQATGTSLNTTVDFGFIIAPTLVTLETFDVFSDNDGLVTVKWATASEDDNLGFNVYREVGGKRELINSSPIIGTALRSRINLEAKSAGYSWTDIKPVDGAVYYLEDIDMKGMRTMHGPVTPVMRDSGSNRRPNPRLLADLSELSGESKQVDSIARVETAQKAAKTTANTANRGQQFEVAARNGVKIAVRREGWYRISLAELQNAGFDLNSDPNNWQLFRDGEEIPFRFGADNAVEFYGHGLDLPETDKQIYYLTLGKVAGQRLPEEIATELAQSNDADSFRNTATLKGRTIYFPAILNGDKENWFGAIVSPGGSVNQNLAAYNPHQSGQAHLKVRLQGVGNVAHSVNLSFNNVSLGAVNFEGYTNQIFEFDLPMSTIVNGNNRLTLTGIGGPSDYVAVDEINLTYERKFTARDNKLTFRVPAGNSVKVDGFSDANINVVELNNSRAVRRFAVQSEQTESGFAFSLNAVGYDREFTAFTDSQIGNPVSIVRNNPSRWNSANNKAQFVIIAPEIFREAATNLANVRRQEGILTVVVPVEDIFDEFSFGKYSATAVKKFLQTARETWNVAPDFVLLFGDTSYDMRNYLAQPDRNLVPTKLIDTPALQTSSDAWLADFDDDGIEDISIGRLPAGTEAEAAQLVGKITRPAQTDNIRQERTNLFVADSGFDVNADELRAVLPEGIGSSVIRRSELDTSQTRNEIINQTNNGQSVITYFGHGSSIAWSNSGFFQTTDTVNLKNEKLAFYLLMTCLNGYAVDPGSDSLAESLIKADNGAFAVWSSSGATHTYGQAEISRTATDLIFNRPDNPLRIGEIVRLSKSATQDTDIRRTWLLIGDPTMFVR